MCHFISETYYLMSALIFAIDVLFWFCCGNTSNQSPSCIAVIIRLFHPCLLRVAQDFEGGLSETSWIFNNCFLCLLLSLWQLETFKRTLMQSLQEDDENPAVSHLCCSFDPPSTPSLFVSYFLEANHHFCGFRVRVVRSEELQTQIWQSEEHHVSYFITNPGSAIGFISLLWGIL